ncbi:hypothetical protein HF319_04960 [Xanthomonas sp. Kuri4-1]
MLAGLILLAALSRLLPHPPNFSPVEAIALFGGAHFASRRWALLVPLAGMALSDIALALIGGVGYLPVPGIGPGHGDASSYLEYLTRASYLPALLAVYGCIVLCTLLGFGLRGRVNGPRVLGYALAGSALFFVLSNFATWLTAFAVPGYPACSTSLTSCYAAALPFLQWTVLGTLTYSALLFGGFALLRRRLPALRLQTV